MTAALKLCLLNIWEATDLTQNEKSWVSLGWALAKRNIAQKRGVGEMPTIRDWVADMDRAMIAEKDAFKHRGCPKKWDRKWAAWNIHRGEICLSPTVELQRSEVRWHGPLNIEGEILG